MTHVPVKFPIVADCGAVILAGFEAELFAFTTFSLKRVTESGDGCYLDSSASTVLAECLDLREHVMQYSFLPLFLLSAFKTYKNEAVAEQFHQSSGFCKPPTFQTEIGPQPGFGGLALGTGRVSIGGNPPKKTLRTSIVLNKASNKMSNWFEPTFGINSLLSTEWFTFFP